jgi:hypothetical protein
VAYREFVDDAGVFWRVWDTYPIAATTLRNVSPVYANGWLTFESETERRRLAPIPEHWEMASRDAIGDWCANAPRVSAPGPVDRADVSDAHS